MFALLFAGALAFAEDLFEGTDLAEEDVAGGAADLAVGAGILGPDEPAEDLVGFGFLLLEAELVLEGALLVSGDGGAEFDEVGLGADPDETEAVAQDAEVVPDRAVEVEFLEGGGADVAAWEGELEFGGAVGRDLEDELGRDLVGATVGVDQPEVIGAAGGQEEIGDRSDRLVGWGEQRDRGEVGSAGLEDGVGDGLVELEDQVELAALDGGDATGVLDALAGAAGVFGVSDVGDRTFEARVFEHRDLEVGGAADIGFDAIGEVVGDVGDGAAEDGVGEVPDEGKAAGELAGGGDDDLGVAGNLAEAGEHDEGRSLFEFGVAGSDLDSVDDAGEDLGGGGGRAGCGQRVAGGEEEDGDEGEEGNALERDGGEDAADRGEPRPLVSAGVIEGLVEDAGLEEVELAVGFGLLFDGGDQESVEVGVMRLDLACGGVEVGGPGQSADEGEQAGDEAHGGESDGDPEHGPSGLACDEEDDGGDDGDEGPRGGELEGGAAPDLTVGDGAEQA